MKHGRRVVNVYNPDGSQTQQLVYRLTAFAFLDMSLDKHQVNHKDGTMRGDADNLEWCSARENVIHAYKTNLKK
jgi:hypothetical protein